MKIDLEKLGARKKPSRTRNEEIYVFKKWEFLKIIDWIEKSEKEQDEFNKFFSLWVAFNIFYNLYSNNRGNETYRVTNVLNILSEEETKEIVETQLKNSLIDWFNSIRDSKIRLRRSSENLHIKCKENYDNHMFHDTLEFLLKALYAIRCNLFHGEKEFKDTHQSDILRKSYAVLKILFSIIMVKYLVSQMRLETT